MRSCTAREKKDTDNYVSGHKTSQRATLTLSTPLSLLDCCIGYPVFDITVYRVCNPIMMNSIQQQNHGGVCGANDMCLLIFDDDDGEIITVDDANKDEVDNNIARKKISLLNKWKRNHRRSTASIIRTDHPPVKASRAVKMSTSLPTINESRNDVEEEGFMIPDDMSESSFTVLKRYMGYSSTPYGSKRPVVARDRDHNRVDAPSNEDTVKEDIKSTQPPSLPLTQTRDDIEDDNASETSSLDVLMRYIGCTPISYCDHKQHSTTIATSDQIDETGNRNDISPNLSHIYGSYEIDDRNSLLPDNDEEEESIDDVTPEQRHALLIEVIKEMIAGSNDHHQAERNIDISTRREEEACKKIEIRDVASGDQKEVDGKMKSVQRMSSPRKILFKHLLAKRLHGKKDKHLKEGE